MEKRKQYEILISKAGADIRNAKRTFRDTTRDIDDDETIMFHLQQAVEKSLKAVLSFNNIEFPMIHDIKRLFKLLEKNNLIILNKYKELSILTTYATLGKYDNLGDLEDSILEHNINIVEELYEDLKTYISES